MKDGRPSRMEGSIKPDHIRMSLKLHLDDFLNSFPKNEHLAMDPVQFVHRFSDPEDREVVGFVASALSYGNVKSVLHSVDQIIEKLGKRPSDFIASFDPKVDAKIFNGFYHRWNTGKDVAVLLWILGRMRDRHGSLEGAVASGLSKQGRGIETALESFALEARGFGHEQFYAKDELNRRRGVLYFFPRVSGGSACKRLNLFMRWMVRSDDGIDCGVWGKIPPSELVIPLDTHITRISQYIGLTEMQTPGWKMALDVTKSLRELDSTDPLRYDFALCHLGIAGDCPKRRDLSKCFRCPIKEVCRL